MGSSYGAHKMMAIIDKQSGEKVRILLNKDCSPFIEISENTFNLRPGKIDRPKLKITI